jgi:hypothetical protein
MAGSIIFTGFVPDDATDLAPVLANFSRLAGMAEKAYFLFAENIANPSATSVLASWCADCPNAAFLAAGGREPGRPSERSASCRNRILAAIRDMDLGGYDALCVMDFTTANAGEIAPDGFLAAMEFLLSHRVNAGVFAVSDPIYYDIDALRRQGWCEADWQLAFRAAPVISKIDVFQTLVCDKQIPIDKSHPPIYVESAFCGLALYRLSYALQAMYADGDTEGEETCEHVRFNERLRELGGDLYIFPALRNVTPWQACFLGQQQKTMRLSNKGAYIELLAPQSHQLDNFLSAYPLYDRRLSLLLAIFNRLLGPASLLDIGANILDTIALLRSSGVELSRSVSVDASLEFYKYARFNAQKNRELRRKNEIVWGFVGAGEDAGNVAAVNGTGNVRNLRRADADDPLLKPRHTTFADLARAGADLVKIDLDGYDHVAIRENLAWLKRWKPMLWAEAQIEDGTDKSAWSNIFLALADDFPYVAAFDNYGFCLCAGTLAENWNLVLELIGIGARYRANEPTAGKARFYYVDVLLVPRHRAQVFDAFIAELPELKLASAGTGAAVSAATPALPIFAEARDFHAQIG